MVILVGAVTADEDSVSVTAIPPEGAAEVKVTVPFELIPPVTAVGLNENELNAAAATTLMLTVAALLVPVPSLAI